MKKSFLTVIGAVAIILALSLNLRHASNDYGLRTSTFWSNVKAEESSGTGFHRNYLCILELCEITNWEFEKCMFNCGFVLPYASCYFPCCTASDCDIVKIGGRAQYCTIDYPPGYNIHTVGVSQCGECNINTCLDWGLIITTTN